MGRVHVPLDVNYADDPKIIEAGERAEILYVRALAFCKKLLSDGRVSDSQLQRFGLRGVTKRAQRLVEVGLWERVSDAEGDGYQIVAWLKHNKSAEEIRALSVVRAEAGKQGGRPPQSKLVRPPKANEKPAETLREEKRREGKTETRQDPPGAANEILAVALKSGKQYPERFKGQLGKAIKDLLAEGISPQLVTDAAWLCVSKGRSPSIMPSLVVEVQASGANNGYRNSSEWTAAERGLA